MSVRRSTGFSNFTAQYIDPISIDKPRLLSYCRYAPQVSHKDGGQSSINIFSVENLRQNFTVFFCTIVEI